MNSRKVVSVVIQCVDTHTHTQEGLNKKIMKMEISSTKEL